MRMLIQIACGALLLASSVLDGHAQDMKPLKAGVVRIKNNSSGEVGAGLIVKIDKSLVYIVTASHVVRGDANPQIVLFNDQFHTFSAEQVNRDDDNPRGLALLVFKFPDATRLSGLNSLRLSDASDVSGGENIKVIGFPSSTQFWDVSAGVISHIEGNNLIFAAPIKGGNSGGPVFLSDGRVVGIVTDTIESKDTSFAPKADIIVSYVNGLVPGLIGFSDGRKQNIVLVVRLEKIVVHQDGSAASTSWNFEVFAEAKSIIQLGERGFNDRAAPVTVNKTGDVEVEPDKTITLKIVGDKSAPGVQARGQMQFQWKLNETADLPLEVPVKVPGAIKKGDFTFVFTIKRKS